MRSGVDVARMIADVESAHVERTTSTSNTAKFAEAVCAFANDMPGSGEPGFLIIGADDARQVAGLRFIASPGAFIITSPQVEL